VWHRYRTEGTVTGGIVQRWRDRVEELEAEADRASTPPAPPATDAELTAWEAYRDDLQRRDPPGGRT
jgi:hypothetical protein